MRGMRIRTALGAILLAGGLAGCGEGETEPAETAQNGIGAEQETGGAVSDSAESEDAVTDAEAAPAEPAEPEDPYLWLEEVEGEEALDWVRAQNERSLAELEGDPRFEPFKTSAEDILNATDRIPYGALRGDHVYNFWQDETHVRGIWRRAPVAGYLSGSPDWEVLLDLDALAEAEDENWVWKGSDCLAPDYVKCLITLSRGGGDAAVEREFDVASKNFVEGGFEVPEAKSQIAWVDADTLLVGTDWGPDSLTTSGYPRQIRLWRRGTALNDAPLVFEGKAEDVAVSPFVLTRPDGTFPLAVRSVGFFNQEYHLFPDLSEPPVKLPLPEGAQLRDIFKGQVLFSLREPYEGILRGGESRELAAGTLLSFPLEPVLENGLLPGLTIVLEPGERTTVNQVTALEDRVVVTTLENVIGKLTVFEFNTRTGAWTGRPLDVPDNGDVSTLGGDPYGDRIFVKFESFLTPDQLFVADAVTRSMETVDSLPDRFDAGGLTIQQFEATSADGTKIPYFIVHPEEMPFDGQAPTLLYGYGGFEISLTPSYGGVTGKLWLERGNVYVVANIRGGGEFGPAWHQAALLENRQRAYDDFIAVAEDLIARGVTSPDHLGIYGGSNGGLLVGAVMVQRPDLFDAVVSAVPLLDMIRYTELPPGASWMAEYGDPSDPDMREAILGYSPYQNVEEEVGYPRVFFVTSTRDDRVHPGHARKMARKMMDYGNEVLYYENIEGGHSASANLAQAAYRNALQFVYLVRQLEDNWPAEELGEVPAGEPAGPANGE